MKIDYLQVSYTAQYANQSTKPNDKRASSSSSSTELVPARDAEWGDLHGRGHHQWCLRRVTDGVLVVHEATGHNGLVLRDHLIAVTTLKPLLVLVALVVAVLHLQEVPHHAVLAHCGHQMPLLFPVFGHLFTRTWVEGSPVNNMHISTNNGY